MLKGSGPCLAANMALGSVPIHFDAPDWTGIICIELGAGDFGKPERGVSRCKGEMRDQGKGQRNRADD